MILLDTNLLARITNSADPRCAVTFSTVDFDGFSISLVDRASV